MKNTQIVNYAQFQLNWMFTHGYNLKDIYNLADEWAHDEELRQCYDHFEEYVEDVGFNGTIWPCFAEWEENEYMEGLC